MASPPPPRRRWLLEGAGAAFQHAADSLHGHVSQSRLTYDQQTKLSTVPYAYEPGLIARLLGAVLKAAHAYGGKVAA